MTSNRHQSGFKGIVTIGSLVIMGCTCIGLRACFPNNELAGLFIIAILLLWQVIAISLLNSERALVASVILFGLLMKILAGWLQMITAQWSTSDELLYFEQGRQLALTAKKFSDIFSLQQLSGINSGTNAVVSITAGIFNVLGPSLPIAVIIFSIAGFWGQYLYYMTFRRIFPDANRLYAALGMFTWPSLFFWTAEVGKDALMIFFLGLASYSVSLSSQRKHLARVLLALASIGACLIRPHIGVLMGISLAASFSLIQREGQLLRPRKRVIRIAVLSCVACFLVYVCAQFLQLSNIAETIYHLEVSMQTNQLDGSGFNPGSGFRLRILLSPLLIIRPFPWETNGVSALFASAEGMSLLTLIVFWRRELIYMIRRSSSNSCLTFMIWFVALNVILLGIGTSNFGLLVRERVMILPMLILALAASPSIKLQPTRRLQRGSF
jgi:hypothetical protein